MVIFTSPGSGCLWKRNLNKITRDEDPTKKEDGGLSYVPHGRMREDLEQNGTNLEKEGDIAERDGRTAGGKRRKDGLMIPRWLLHLLFSMSFLSLNISGHFAVFCFERIKVAVSLRI